MGFFAFRENETNAAALEEATKPLLEKAQAELNDFLRALYAVESQVSKTRKLHRKEISEIFAESLKTGQPFDYKQLSAVQPANDFSKTDFIKRINAPRYELDSALFLPHMFTLIQSKHKPQPGYFAKMTGGASDAYKHYHETILNFGLSHCAALGKVIQRHIATRDSLLPTAEATLEKMRSFHEEIGQALAVENAAPLPSMKFAFRKFSGPFLLDVLKQPVAGHASALAGLLVRSDTDRDRKQAIETFVNRIGDKRASISYLWEVSTGVANEHDKAFVIDNAEELTSRFARAKSSRSRSRETEKAAGLSTGQKVAIGVAVAVVLGS